MVNPHKIFGRLGNSMFQYAFCYAYARDNDIDYYFQDPEYFDHYRKEIKQLFGTGITPNNKVGIHVRRATNPLMPHEPKYSENSFYVNLTDTDYYQRAMAMFPGKQFVVFSDDINWCKEQDMFKGCEFAEGSELEDLNYMAGCEGIIMANSSFSWWAAYLSDAKVIAPKAWYADGAERTKLLTEWTRI